MGILFSSTTRPEQAAESAARASRGARTMRETSAEASRRVNPIPHPVCLGLDSLDYKFFRLDVLLDWSVPSCVDEWFSGGPGTVSNPHRSRAKLPEMWAGILGPVFWALATIFSTIALLARTKGAARSFCGRQYRT